MDLECAVELGPYRTFRTQVGAQVQFELRTSGGLERWLKQGGQQRGFGLSLCPQRQRAGLTEMDESLHFKVRRWPAHPEGFDGQHALSIVQVERTLVFPHQAGESDFQAARLGLGL